MVSPIPGGAPSGHTQDKASHFLAQHSQNYLTVTSLGGTRYATMSATRQKKKLKMKNPMKL